MTRASDIRDQFDPADGITTDDVERALDGTPAPFPDPEAEAQDDQPDDDQAFGLLTRPQVAAGKVQRCANAKRLRDQRTFVGVNRCLATVRGPILEIDALYPTAAIAGHHSSPFHRQTNPDADVPRASIGFAFNGGAGHTWLELGTFRHNGRADALVSTTDFHESGFEGIALRSRMLTWCSADSWGWGESVNGVDVWPDAKPKPPPPDHEFVTWPWARKVEFLRNEAKRERADGHPFVGRQLDAWADKIAARHQDARK